MNKIQRKSCLFSITLLLSFSIVPLANAADDLTQQLAKSDDLLNKSKPKAAATILRSIIRSNPNCADAHMQLGAALAQQVDNNNYDEAIAEEQLALKLDTKSFGARKILGKIYANQHKFQESISVLKEACQLNPTSFAAHRDLGKAYSAAGKNDEAIAAYKKAIENKPKAFDTYLKLSLLLSEKGDYPAAIKEANEAVAVAGNKAETHLTLANMKLDSGDSAGSIDSFKTAIEKNGFDALGCLNPLTAAGAFSGLGWAMTRDPGTKNLEEGVSNQRKAIKMYPPYLPAYVRLAELLHLQGKDKMAEATYQKGLVISGGDRAIATSYARFLDSIGRKDEARSILKKVLSKSPDFKQASDALSAIDQQKSK